MLACKTILGVWKWWLQVVLVVCGYCEGLLYMRELTTQELEREQLKLYCKSRFQTKYLCQFLMNCLIFVGWSDCKITCLLDATSVDCGWKLCFLIHQRGHMEHALHWQIKHIEWWKTIVSTTPIQPSFSFLYYIPTWFHFFLNNAVGRNVNPVYCWQERNGRKTHSCPKNGMFNLYFVSGTKEAVIEVETVIDVKTIIIDYCCIDHPFINSDV